MFVVSLQQEILRLRREALDACDFARKMGDSYLLYGPPLGCISRLIVAIRPKRFPSGNLRSRAQKLKRLLSGLYSKMEVKAINRVSGLCAVIYDEISGEAGSAMYRRVEAAGTAEKMGSSLEYYSSSSSGGNGQRRPQQQQQRSGNASKGFFKRELADVRCHGCKQLGHYKNRCPENKDAAK